MPKAISGQAYTTRVTRNGLIVEPSTTPPDADQLPMHDEEDVVDYNPGGYLNVNVGDEFYSPNRRSPYVAVRKLGWGHFSTVWLVLNEDDGRFAAMKVSSSRYEDTAKDEIRLLMEVRNQAFRATTSRHSGITQWEEHPGAKHVVSLLDYFSTRGRYRDHHLCMVLNPLGENLLSLLDRHRITVREDGREELTGVPMGVVKVIAKQVLMGLQYLHEECGLVHTDIKPENILLALPNAQEYIRAQLTAEPARPTQRVSLPSRRSKRGEMVPRKTLYVDMYVSQPITGPRMRFEHQPRDLSRRQRTHAVDGSPRSDQTRSRSRGNHSIHTPREGNPPFPITVQISDLGNAAPVEEHFTDDIQTRQYRSPEAIIRRSDWGTAVDVWSVACMVFELLTGDHLFDPRRKAGHWDKDDDHMAQIIELCGDFDLRLKVGGKFSRDIFTSRGKLRRIRHLKPKALEQVLEENYYYRARDAKHLAAFLYPMLCIDPEERATAREMIGHRWVDSWDEGDPVLRAPRLQPQRKRRLFEATTPSTAFGRRGTNGGGR